MESLCCSLLYFLIAIIVHSALITYLVNWTGNVEKFWAAGSPKQGKWLDTIGHG